MKQTAMQMMYDELIAHEYTIPLGLIVKCQELIEMEKEHKILLVQQLIDYTKEAQCVLGNDEREASEFVEIFYQSNFKSDNMENKLKSLEEHNTETSNLHWGHFNSNEPRPNGIACPNCAEELVDSNPMITLTSFPPKKNVNCTKCDYVGYRVA